MQANLILVSWTKMIRDPPRNRAEMVHNGASPGHSAIPSSAIRPVLADQRRMIANLPMPSVDEAVEAVEVDEAEVGCQEAAVVVEGAARQSKSDLERARDSNWPLRNAYSEYSAIVSKVVSTCCHSYAAFSVGNLRCLRLAYKKDLLSGCIWPSRIIQQHRLTMIWRKRYIACDCDCDLGWSTWSVPTKSLEKRVLQELLISRSSQAPLCNCFIGLDIVDEAFQGHVVVFGSNKAKHDYPEFFAIEVTAEIMQNVYFLSVPNKQSRIQNQLIQVQ